MRLLLTRSAADAAGTREKLEAMGHKVIVSPVIEMVATGAAFPTGVVDAVLATSAKAFTVPLDGLAPEVRRLMPLFLVGGRTAEAAKAAGFLGPETIAPNAGRLAETIGGLASQPRRIVYIAGRERKPDLEIALAAMGQALDVVDVYDARPVDRLSVEAIEAFERGAIDGVLHYSRRSASLLLAVVSGTDIDLRRPVHFCLSEDVARPLREGGCSEVAVAGGPIEGEMLKLIGSERAGG